MLKIILTNRFEKNLQRMIKRGKDINKIQFVIELLCQQRKLPTKYREHLLIGNRQGFWECHIEPDWLLIYKIDESELLLADTGTHSDLF
jgi:mRNA interferase YafQ